MEFTSFIGIEISKKKIDVAFLDKKGKLITHKTLNNNLSGFKQFLCDAKHYRDAKDCLVCLEHTGIYSLPLCVFLEEKGINYSLQSGLQIKRSMGIQRGKNDKADAFVIGTEKIFSVINYLPGFF